MRSVAAVLFLFVAAHASAQVVSRPTELPIVTADNDAWYRLREPVTFAGDSYYPAGPTVFFDGNRMVRTGHYNGVPLYADATLEPYSLVFVPIGGGLMQPYERVRRGELAGTAGSRTPSFPVATAPEPRRLAAGGATPPGRAGQVDRATSEPGAVGTTGRISQPVVVGTGGTIAASRPPQYAVTTLRRAESNDGIWVEFLGRKWVSAGAAVPLRAADFARVGEYTGAPVFARQGLDEDLVYLLTGTGAVAPFRLKQ